MRIRATAPFSNDRYLSHLDENRVERGQVVEVAGVYAERVIEKGIAEPAEDEAGASPQAPEWALGEHDTSGYYFALYDGERVEDGEGEYMTVGQGEDDARQAIVQHNEDGTLPADILDA